MKPSKQRSAVRALSRSGRTARREREDFLTLRRAAAAAWRKVPREIDRLKGRLLTELVRAAERFNALDAPIVALDAVASTERAYSSPAEMLESLTDDVTTALDAFSGDPAEYDEQIANVKGATRV